MSNNQQKKFETTEPAITVAAVAADQVTQAGATKPINFGEALAQGLAQAAAAAGATKAEVAALADEINVTNAGLKLLSPALSATLRSGGFYAEAEGLGGAPAPKSYMEKASAFSDRNVKIKHVGLAVVGTAVAVVAYDLVAREMDWKRPGLFQPKAMEGVPVIEAPKKK